MDERDMTPNERLIEVKTKLETLISSVDKMNDTLSKLPSRSEFADLKERVGKLESAPRAWGPIIIAGISLLLQFMR